MHKVNTSYIKVVRLAVADVFEYYYLSLLDVSENKFVLYIIIWNYDVAWFGRISNVFSLIFFFHVIIEEDCE